MELIVKYGAIIGAVWTAATWVYLQYREARREHLRRSEAAEVEKKRQIQAAKIALRESQKPFLEKQLDFYFEAAKVTAKLATLPREPGAAEPRLAEDWAWARRRFWELYWGELGIVESPEVVMAMIAFGSSLQKLEKCQSSGPECDALQKGLTSISIQLAHKIRDSIQQSWDYKLPELPSRESPK